MSTNKKAPEMGLFRTIYFCAGAAGLAAGCGFVSVMLMT